MLLSILVLYPFLFGMSQMFPFLVSSSEFTFVSSSMSYSSFLVKDLLLSASVSSTFLLSIVRRWSLHLSAVMKIMNCSFIPFTFFSLIYYNIFNSSWKLTLLTLIILCSNYSSDSLEVVEVKWRVNWMCWSCHGVFVHL